MKVIGIFLGYSPEQPIRKEGLGRLLAFILNGLLINKNTKVVIACPLWYRNHIYDLLDDHKILKDCIEIITTQNIPPVIFAHEKINQFFHKKKKENNFSAKALAICKKMLINFIATTNWSAIFFVAFLFLIFLPFAVSVLGVFFLTRSIKNLLINSINIATKNKAKKLYCSLSQPLNKFKKNNYAIAIHDALKKRELLRLISLIDNRSDINAWLIPTLFWPEATSIKAKKVFVCPDIVMYDFPAQFSDHGSCNALKNLEKTVNNASDFITYSKYTRDNHLVSKFGISTENIKVINHGRVSMLSYLKYGNSQENNKEKIRERSIEILRNYISTKHWASGNWQNFDLRRDKFIFYPSQYRPYKNIFQLVKLVKSLNFDHGIPIRLILTANIFDNEDVKNYIVNNNLNYIIMQAYDVNSETLAALYALSTISINPTLFEGGFPFTFCEAYSVGTPSLMSKIPVVSEIILERAPWLANVMLFDPYDLDDLIDKAINAISNREALFDQQKILFDSFPTWEQIAEQYIDYLI